ncbi:hypothetical protein Ahy_A03g014477 [Arachis hypogaea]|uniref:Uncharacterized protein n=1 Tax=Arachis hypogaea TaxID=3818 RepID=A0A445DY51_ARAHY|nr:hypothetical protein Ahy_A03g014477 [Arachis hypogaea]
MGRHSYCYKQKLWKGLWSPKEDEKLLRHIIKYGHGCWSSVPKQAGLQRCSKSCRLRWIIYLRPNLKEGTNTISTTTIHNRLGWGLTSLSESIALEFNLNQFIRLPNSQHIQCDKRLKPVQSNISAYNRKNNVIIS